jgi:hypothetical protein
LVRRKGDIKIRNQNWVRRKGYIKIRNQNWVRRQGDIRKNSLAEFSSHLSQKASQFIPSPQGLCIGRRTG